MILEYEDDEPVILCAVEHAIGRRSYIVGFMVDWLIRHWQKISFAYRKIIIQRVCEAIDNQRAGDACDVEDWKRLIQHAEENP